MKEKMELWITGHQTWKWSTPLLGSWKLKKDWTTTQGGTTRKKTGEVTGKTGVVKNPTKKEETDKAAQPPPPTFRFRHLELLPRTKMLLEVKVLHVTVRRQGSR